MAPDVRALKSLDTHFHILGVEALSQVNVPQILEGGLSIIRYQVGLCKLDEAHLAGWQVLLRAWTCLIGRT